MRTSRFGVSHTAAASLCLWIASGERPQRRRGNALATHGGSDTDQRDIAHPAPRQHIDAVLLFCGQTALNFSNFLNNKKTNGRADSRAVQGALEGALSPALEVIETDP
jgi:hypothetical protein